jgi:hypothetical protein
MMPSLLIVFGKEESLTLLKNIFYDTIVLQCVDNSTIPSHHLNCPLCLCADRCYEISSTV